MKLLHCEQQSKLAKEEFTKRELSSREQICALELQFTQMGQQIDGRKLQFTTELQQRDDTIAQQRTQHRENMDEQK